MTPAELRAALTELGWSAPHLARLLGVGEKTPTNWLLGRAKVPQDVEEWLDLRLGRHRWEAHNYPPPRAASTGGARAGKPIRWRW